MRTIALADMYQVDASERQDRKQMNDPEMDAILAQPDVRRFERWVLFINGLIALAGVGIAGYVYFHHSLPPEIGRPGLDRYGQPLRLENTLSLLFMFPFFQIWIACAPFLTRWFPLFGRFADTVGSRMVRIGLKIARVETPGRLSAGEYKMVLAVFVLFEVIGLVGTIYHANLVSAAGL